MAGQQQFDGPDEDAAADPAPVDNPKPVDNMAFEDAMAELEAIVQKLERGQINLEESIAAFERGTQLRKRCEAKLKEAELRIEKLVIDPNGDIGTEAFEA